MADTDTAERIRGYWNARERSARPRRLYWYHHPQALAHYRGLVSRAPAPAGTKPIQCWLSEHFSGRRFERGLSVGCGAGHKELALMKAGIVGRFDLFELSDAVIATGRCAAIAEGLAERARFRCEDIFARPALPEGEYDLVHWDNALHHMFDTAAALAASVRALRPGGLLVIDDYVGPSHMQVPDRLHAVAQPIRAALPERYLANNTADAARFPLLPRCPRIPREAMIAADPSEMADSAAILPAARRLLPGATVIPTGGILYFFGLRPLFGNFDEHDPYDRDLLADLLAFDADWTRAHPADTFHAFIAWQKPG